MKIDLHNHTTYSDGLFTPKELIEIAKKEGVDCIAITDHDSVFGCTEALEAAKSSQIQVLCGMELSTEYKGHSIHIVCLFPHNVVPKEMLEFSLAKKKEREERAIQMMKKIQEIYHVKIDIDRLLEENEVITRANMGYNIAQCNQISQKEAEKYISNTSKAYIPSTKLSVEEGLKIVKTVGCVTILAHPCLLPRELVEEIIQFGIDGIEFRYPKNQPTDESYFKKLACKYHLLLSAGSDFHGDDGTKHAPMGTSTLNEEEFIPLKERLGLV